MNGMPPSRTSRGSLEHGSLAGDHVVRAHREAAVGKKGALACSWRSWFRGSAAISIARRGFVRSRSCRGAPRGRLLDGFAERESQNAHVVRWNSLAIQDLQGFAHSGIAPANRHHANLGARGALDDGSRHELRRRRVLLTVRRSMTSVYSAGSRCSRRTVMAGASHVKYAPLGRNAGQRARRESRRHPVGGSDEVLGQRLQLPGPAPCHGPGDTRRPMRGAAPSSRSCRCRGRRARRPASGTARPGRTR